MKAGVPCGGFLWNYNSEGKVCMDKEGTGEQMTAIRGLAEIVLAVHDMDRALAFYEGVLGLERIPAPPEVKPAFLRVGPGQAGIPQMVVLVPLSPMLLMVMAAVPRKRRRYGTCGYGGYTRIRGFPVAKCVLTEACRLRRTPRRPWQLPTRPHRRPA